MAVEAGGIGARLRAGREKHGLTVLQVAERIHTDPKVVEAIEAENFEALGAPVYARGHMRHYAELVGESGAELIALYSELSKIAEPDLTRIVKAPPSSDSSKLVAPALVVIAVFAVAGAIWWVSALSKKKPQLSETHVVGEETPASITAPVSEPSPAPAGAPGQAPAQASAQTTTQTKSAERNTPPGTMAMQARPGATTRATSSTQGGAPPSRPGSASAGPTPPRSAATGSAPTPRSGSASSTPTQSRSAQSVAASTAPPPDSRNQVQVTLRYSADSWTEVYDASGARLFYDVGAANSVQIMVGTPPLRVVLGNASGVAVEFNGHSKPIAKLSQPDGSVQFSINRSGQVVRAKPVADGG
jgi:cytoskeleton protein RodZ